MIYIAICDDDDESVIKLRDKVKSCLKHNKIIADITVYTQSKLLQYDIQEGKYYDLLLSDIEMPHINGMNLAVYIKNHLPDLIIIFITSHLKYTIDAFTLSIFRYIPKSTIDERLPQAFMDAINMIKIQSDQYYIIQTPTRIEKIPYRKIVYISREGKNSVIYLKENKKTKVRKSLSQVYKEFAGNDFVYVDRGNIVNLSHIMGIRKDVIELSSGLCLPVSHTRLEMIKEKLNDFWGERIWV